MSWPDDLRWRSLRWSLCSPGLSRGSIALDHHRVRTARRPAGQPPSGRVPAGARPLRVIPERRRLIGVGRALGGRDLAVDAGRLIARVVSAVALVARDARSIPSRSRASAVPSRSSAPLALVGGPLPLVGHSLALIRRLLAPIGLPLARVRRALPASHGPSRRCWRSGPPRAPIGRSPGAHCPPMRKLRCHRA